MSERHGKDTAIGTSPLRDNMASPGRVGSLSLHFAAAEFACRHCHACIVVDELLLVLERIRSHVGQALPIVSGYRCPIRNKAAGGAGDSQHMYGTAADLPLGIVTPAVARHCGAVGIGVQHGWVRHVDVRGGPPVTWTY